MHKLPCWELPGTASKINNMTKEEIIINAADAACYIIFLDMQF